MLKSSGRQQNYSYRLYLTGGGKKIPSNSVDFIFFSLLLRGMPTSDIYSSQRRRCLEHQCAQASCVATFGLKPRGKGMGPGLKRLFQAGRNTNIMQKGECSNGKVQIVYMKCRNEGTVLVWLEWEASRGSRLMYNWKAQQAFVRPIEGCQVLTQRDQHELVCFNN